MRKYLLSFLLAGSFISFSNAQEMSSGQAEEVKKAILKLEEDRYNTLIKGGSFAADWVKSHDDDEMVMVEGDGSTVDKQRHIHQFQTGTRKDLSIKDTDFKVHLFGNGTVAVVTFHADNGVILEGNTIIQQSLSSNVWVKESGTWRRVLHQVSKIPTKSGGMAPSGAPTH
jgi:hypothetical protein